MANRREPNKSQLLSCDDCGKIVTHKVEPEGDQEVSDWDSLATSFIEGGIRAWRRVYKCQGESTKPNEGSQCRGVTDTFQIQQTEFGKLMEFCRELKGENGSLRDQLTDIKSKNESLHSQLADIKSKLQQILRGIPKK